MSRNDVDGSIEKVSTVQQCGGTTNDDDSALGAYGAVSDDVWHMR